VIGLREGVRGGRKEVAGGSNGRQVSRWKRKGRAKPGGERGRRGGPSVARAGKKKQPKRSVVVVTEPKGVSTAL
jgi:hypothetical protein